MNLRHHVETAVMVSRIVLVAADSRPVWPDSCRHRFWNTVGYLEHLWSREQDHQNWNSDNPGRDLLIEEVLVGQLLIRCVAAATDSLISWQKHCAVVEERLAGVLEGPALHPSRQRLSRMRRRMGHWGDFLVSRHRQGEHYADDADRCCEFRSSYRFNDEAVWSLLTQGISRTVPDLTLTDPARVAVHGMLREMALGLISTDDFLRDGRLKPRWMRRIEWRHQPDGAV